MIRILFLTILFNCNKINLRNLKNNDKYPVGPKLIKAIKEANNLAIEEEINKLNIKGIKLQDLREGSKNFLMLLIQNYGVNYEYKKDKKNKDEINEGSDEESSSQEEFDIVDEKKKIFKKYLREFHDLINDSDENGRTILFYAIDTGIGELVKEILDISGVNTEYLDIKDISPLNYCIINKADIFDYLNKTTIPNTSLTYLTKFNFIRNKKLAGTSPLIVACCSKKGHIAKALLENGTNVDIENDKDTKAIWLAAHYGEEEIAEELLARGAKHLSNRGIILHKVGNVLGPIMKALLQKSIDASLMAAGKVPGLDIPGIPVGLDVNSIFNRFQSNPELNKIACYKEVRRIYKKGNWITKIEHIDENVAIEYGELLADIVYRINKKHSELIKAKKSNSKSGNIKILKRILAINKFNEDSLPGDEEVSKDYAFKIKEEINKFLKISDSNIEIDSALKALSDGINENIFSSKEALEFGVNIGLEVNSYEILNELKEKALRNYLKLQGTRRIPSFYELEILVDKTLSSFKKLIGGRDCYESLIDYLHDSSKKTIQSKEKIIEFFNKFKKTKKVLINLKKQADKIHKTKKVSKINTLKAAVDKFYIKGENVDTTYDVNEDESKNKMPKLKIREGKAKKFIRRYKKLIEKRELLFNFIDRNIN